MILAVDPGKKASGVVILDGQHFAWAGMAADWAELGGHALWAESITHVVCERMQIYDRKKSKGDPNHLIDLAIVAGRWAGACPDARFWFPRPAEWKGQVPKDIHHARVLKKMPERTREGLLARVGSVPMGLRHNVLDAACLAWWLRDKLLTDKV